MIQEATLSKFKNIDTPFYFYDTTLLKETIKEVLKESKKYNYIVHYAMKANVNDPILKIIKEMGLGADCVSGNEVKKALEIGFDPAHIVFAGVGKSDAEINFALSKKIFCFNCESKQELEVINELAGKQNTKARVALRINPNVNANTHHYITTGLEENKFGINIWEFEAVANLLKTLNNIELIGLHFHIGSQITDPANFKSLCLKVNEIQQWFVSHHIPVPNLNMGGGLGVNYHQPDKEAIPDFAGYFKTFNDILELQPNQQVHFELGRSIIAQCGSLISRVLYIKNGLHTNFAILDAGMTDLIRPALYQAYHQIENKSADGANASLKYDVVGPICESSDCFRKAVELPLTKRGDIFAIRTAGAYGEVMVSQYNLREKPKAVYSEDL
jgi:diaminopimelate decarboxylase